MPAPEPADQFANKTLVAAIGTIVTVLLRWAVSGEFSLSDEGLITLAGAITTVAVYAVSNYRALFTRPRGEAGLTPVGVVVALLLVVLIVVLLPVTHSALWLLLIVLVVLALLFL